MTGLQQLGMQVTRVPAYITRCLHKSLYPVELNLLQSGNIDAIAFSSTAEVASFLQMIDSPRDYQNCAIACFGPYTAANARKLYWGISIFGFLISLYLAFYVQNVPLIFIYPSAIYLLYIYSKSLKKSVLWGNLIVSIFCAFVAGIVIFAERQNISSLPDGHQ